jgi:hypothetical protein
MLKVIPGQRIVPADLDAGLIAPCGMNCGLCMCYLRSKNTCSGCRTGDTGKARSVLNCTIRTCHTVAATGTCADCTRLPCPRLRRLDARYRLKYRMSMLENLNALREKGIQALVDSERTRWACPECGGVQCVHTAECIYCGHSWA